MNTQSKNKLDLGKYDLNQLLRNPGTIHRIQKNLSELKGDSLFAESMRQGAYTNISACIREIIEQYRDNSKLVIKIIGKETLALIEEFKGITLADDIKGII